MVGIEDIGVNSLYFSLFKGFLGERGFLAYFSLDEGIGENCIVFSGDR